MGKKQRSLICLYRKGELNVFKSQKTPQRVAAREERKNKRRQTEKSQ